MSEPIGEIIETSSLSFQAESLTLHQPPPLGALVVVHVAGAPYCYAVVSHGSTTSLDPGRRAVRRSGTGVVDEAVYREHPQLERLLQTLFQGLLIGWEDDGTLRPTLPPSPPPLHHAVYLGDAAQVQRVTAHHDYFRLLLASTTPTPPEQLLAAHIRRVVAERGGPDEWLERAARSCALLLKGDHERLVAVLTAIDPV